MVAAVVGKAQTRTRVFGRKSASYIRFAVRRSLTAGTHFDLGLFPVCGFAFPCSPTHGKFIVCGSSITVLICTHSPASCLQTDISICQKEFLTGEKEKKDLPNEGMDSSKTNHTLAILAGQPQASRPTLPLNSCPSLPWTASEKGLLLHFLFLKSNTHIGFAL